MSGKQHKRQHKQQRQGRAQQQGQGTSGRDPEQEAYQQRISRVMGGQLAPATAQGGVRALLRCPSCGRAWLMDSSEPHGARLMIPDQELQALALELQADMGHLPYATCRSCGALHGIGEIQIDEYARGVGYGISWEGADPPGAHLLCAVLHVERAQQLEAQGRPPRPGVVTDFQRCRSWLRWLASLDAPRQYHTLTPAEGAQMATMNRPGHGAPDTDNWVWRGVAWVGECPPLQGSCLCTFSQAMPPDDPYSVTLMFRLWRKLAAIIEEGHITGEDFADEGGQQP